MVVFFNFKCMNSTYREKMDDFVNCLIKYVLEKKMNFLIKLQDKRVTSIVNPLVIVPLFLLFVDPSF